MTPAGQKTGLVWLLVVSILLLVPGCGMTRGRDVRQPVLPFLIRLREVNLPTLDEESIRSGAVSLPALFGDGEEVRRRLARSLEEAGLFQQVVTDDDVIPDLDMIVWVQGEDFGPGNSNIGGVFSTITWLLAGHLSWFIPDREYPKSGVRFAVKILQPQGRADAGPAEERSDETGSLYEDVLPLTELELSFLERADRSHWLLNILVPPCWVEGNARTAGASLARRSLDVFVRQERGDIVSRLPGFYFGKLLSFLHYDREKEEVLIVSKIPVVQVAVAGSGDEPRILRRDQVERLLVPTSERAEVEGRFTAQVEGIGVNSENWYYRLQLDGTVASPIRIAATLENLERCRWTISRESSGPDAAVAAATPTE